MSFASGTINGSTTPALDHMLALHTEIVAHAGWTYIEEVVSGAQVTRIYRCNGATNSHGLDFYVAIRRTSDTVLQLQIALFESWTTGGLGTVAFFVPASSAVGSPVTPDASGRYAVSTTTGIALTNCALGTLNSHGTTFHWSISVTNDRLVFGSNASGSSVGVYAGGYERLYSAAIDPMPIMLGAPFARQINVGSSGVTMFTRELAPFSNLAQLWKGYSQEAAYVLGPHIPGTSKDMTTDRFVAARVLVGGATSATRASARGQLRDVLYSAPGLTPVAGDTATIDGAAYTCVAPSMWVREAA